MATIKDRYVLELDTKGATAALGSLSTAVKGFIGILAVDKVLDFGRAIVQSTAQFQNYENSLRLITNSQQELESTFSTLRDAARSTRSEFGATIDLFTKLTLATESMGKSQDEILEVTQKFQQALAVSGADANTAAGAIRQFGQAMASGTVRGDEFVSITEALGPALNIMARESGLTVGELRRMSQEGELTADTFFNMIRNSESLSAAFNQMRPTINQLETALNDAFDEALVELGEVTGLTNAYEKGISDLTRTLRNYAGTNNLAKMSTEELYNAVENGTLNASEAQEELISRYRELDNTIRVFGQNLDLDFGIGDLIGINEEAQDEIVNTINRLSQLKNAQAETAAQVEQEIQQQQEAAEARRAALAPFRDSIELAEQYARSGYGGALERNRLEIERVKKALEDLTTAEVQEYYTLDERVRLTNVLTTQLGYLEEQQQKIQDQLLGEDIQLYSEFYTAIKDAAADATLEQQFLEQALVQLKEELDAGTISQDIYARALENVNNQLGITDENAREAERALDRFNDSVESALSNTDARIRQMNEAAELSNLEGLQRELRSIELEELRIADAAKARIRAQSESIDASLIEQELARIDAATQEAIASRQAAARTIEANEQRISQIQEQRKQREEAEQERIERAQETFSKGWSRAYEEYADNATNAAKAAERIFEKTTRGMEDAIVNFAKTGKFEFKDLVSTILEELLRSQIQRLIAQTFGAFGAGGGAAGANSLFGGFFANGGTLPAGKFGVVGERGPELITGPANITPLDNFGSATQVVYNINAVDAPSFKSLIARDPGFIHAVAQQGSRKIPVRR
jgi:tape measure domain-containing protein